VGFFERDDRALAAARQWASGRSEESAFTELDSEAAAFDGHMQRSRELRLRAEQLAGSRLNERVVAIRARGALYEAAHSDLTRAHALIKSIAADSPPASALPFLMSAAVLARDNQTLDQLLRQRARSPGSAPESSEELVRILHDVNAGDRFAVLRLPPATMGEVRDRESWRAYLRGLIYLRAQDAAQAASEFQRLLDHRGAATPSPLYPLAYVQQARAYALNGDQWKARKAYQDFLAVWKDADPDIPILREAKREYARLPPHQQ
jgi:eukaryotic-like serine/threonine-protein kinase